MFSPAVPTARGHPICWLMNSSPERLPKDILSSALIRPLRKSVHAEPALTATSITGECIQKDAMRKILPEILGLLSYFIWYCGPYARAYALLCREKSSRNGQPPGQGILLPVEDIGGAWSAWRRAGETYRLSASRTRRTLAGGFVYCLWTARRPVPGRTDCHVAGRGHGGDVMCGCNASSVHAGCVPGGI